MKLLSCPVDPQPVEPLEDGEGGEFIRVSEDDGVHGVFQAQHVLVGHGTVVRFALERPDLGAGLGALVEGDRLLVGIQLVGSLHDEWKLAGGTSED